MLNLLKYESKLWNRGLKLIAGVDEAGRGPLAGPMVVSAVILKQKELQIIKDALETGKGNSRNYDVSLGKNLTPYIKINDSKKLTEKRREKLYTFIIKRAEKYSIIEIPPTEIDQNGITAAVNRGFKDAVNSLKISIHHVLTDYVKIPDLDKSAQTNITKGDSKSLNIAAASILAKVYRDNLMRDYAKKYPEYGFERHKGYGTKKHREIIIKSGPCPIHRKSFEPVKSYLSKHSL